MEVDEKVLGGWAALTAIFVIGAVFGRIAGADRDATGDRVMSGLIAIPLIATGIRAALPHAPMFWALAAPTPLAIYTVLLAATDRGLKKAEETKEPEEPNFVERHFVATLLVSIGAVYVIAAAIALWQ